MLLELPQEQKPEDIEEDLHWFIGATVFLDEVKWPVHLCVTAQQVELVAASDESWSEFVERIRALICLRFRLEETPWNLSIFHPNGPEAEAYIKHLESLSSNEIESFAFDIRAYASFRLH